MDSSFDLDELYYTAIDLLEELIHTPSISREENDAADLIEQFFVHNNITPHRHGNNVWAIANGYDSTRPTLLLNSHIDTVKPVEGWTRHPFNAEVDEKLRLYGLGSNDAGASLVSLIVSFLYLSQRPQPYNLVMLASCEEEVSGKNGIESVIPLLPHIDVAIVGEPTDMQPAIAEKGLMVLDGTIAGVSGHAARNEGINAIYNALPIIETLKSLTFERTSPTLGPVKISVTQIHAGTQHNVVPDCCSIVVDVRTTDAYSNSETLELITKAVPQCKLVPRSTRLNPSSISPNHPIIKRMVLMGATPFGSPTLSDQALMPWQSVKLGPGSSSRSHTANEFIYFDEVRSAIETYIKLLDGLNI
ncbi:MAG: M20 family metallo-hydrolase [Muribaculaceae bacterium]|nr:M20 family metallo-hydrolase [Muribaculaceae bacterium]